MTISGEYKTFGTNQSLVISDDPLDFGSGAWFKDGAVDLCEYADHIGTHVEADFNGYPMKADPGSDPEQVARTWEQDRERWRREEEVRRREEYLEKARHLPATLRQLADTIEQKVAEGSISDEDIAEAIERAVGLPDVAT
jgi:hypothetical protein